MFFRCGHIRSKRDGREGYTMLEIMIIVVIIGIMAAMAVPTFYNVTPKLKARSQARSTLNYIRLARSRAISEGAQVGVYIDAANRQYLIFKDTVNPTLMTYDTGDSILVGPETIDGVVVIVSSTFANNTVVFGPTGSASASGNFVFDKDGGGARYTVSVLGSTGKSKLQ